MHAGGPPPRRWTVRAGDKALVHVGAVEVSPADRAGVAVGPVDVDNGYADPSEGDVGT